jgi:serine phosphatase RsbU (regulator of sigma subunit)
LETVKLQPGETLVLVTDGVTEAQNGQGKLFGSGQILVGYEPESVGAVEICETIRARVRQFEAETEATDDLTVMAVRYL